MKKLLSSLIGLFFVVLHWPLQAIGYCAYQIFLSVRSGWQLGYIEFYEHQNKEPK